MTKNYAVLGSPITHSKSPIIHNAAFGHLGSDAIYSACELADGLQAWLEQLDSSWFGLSLTMPLKEQALEVSTRTDSLAIAANSANTLIRTENGWDAYNTDVFGIQQSLAQLEFRKVLILGTGATARSAIVAMQELGKQVRIWGRNQAALKQLTLEFDISIASQFSDATKADVVISTLPALALDDHLTTLALSSCDSVVKKGQGHFRIGNADLAGGCATTIVRR
jgi:shikimate dehydrogenase